MKCPHCQAENPEGSEFCGDCGRSLRLEIICPKCGHTNPQGKKFCNKCGHSLVEQTPAFTKPTVTEPTSFANGRYQVKKFLGEGGKKKVYLAHDTVIDRDVAFYLIKTEKQDELARTRIKREAQAMGRLGDHPNIVTIFDFGDLEGQPYMVAPLMHSDVEKLIEKAPDHKLPLDKAIEITRSVCKGLEFAHAKGLIHRDIKPGNVLMSADGTVKVGDFGLAVAVDLSRLTQDGIMVGTYYYMPPEQAMGGKITAKADLYSLGAMLYEMVTGRPPFVGEDYVAIIGQHINTPPVSPTWHRADLPPALETLIMQLLEKDPEKRPASATIILQALESIAAGNIKEPSKEITPTENPLYRRVFVGREAELKQLQTAFDGAMSGQGALMMVLGEPGIGKTALCLQLETYVTLRGGRTLVGHCYEEGSLSLPYLAFVEAMRSYVLSREVKDLRDELGTGAADVARIVSEIRERLKIKLRPQKDPEEERYRLMQAVTSFLTNAANVQPLLVVLEDLHDADKGTLDMLTHVSRNLSGARLLIVGTYRDVEVDRTHPLSSALAELRRVSTFGRVVLRGLNADEVRRMLESITLENVPWSLAEAVHRQTEGNPLFVQEVVRYLNEEGLIKREGGQWKARTGTAVEMSIPEGLRDVIGKRLSRLSQNCNRLLLTAAVIGRESSLELLKTVAGMDEAAFVPALKEAIQLSVLEERSQVGKVRYRFTHAFFRQTLYEELIAPERLRLHQHVARALEALYSQQLEEHASELVEHFSQSTDATDLKKAVQYGEMAARRAMVVFAYGEAARLFDQTIRVQKVLDPDNTPRECELILELCNALVEVPDLRRVIEVEAPLAFSLATGMNMSLQAAEACIKVIDALSREQGPTGLATPEAASWAEKALRYSEEGTRVRALAETILGSVIDASGRYDEGAKLHLDAFEIANRLGDGNALWLAAGHLAVSAVPNRIKQTNHIAEVLFNSPRVGLRNGAYGTGSLYLFHHYLSVGKRQRAEETLQELKGRVTQTGNASLELTWMSNDAVLKYMDGKLEEVIDIARRIRAFGREHNISISSDAAASFADFITRIQLGRSLDRLVAAYRSFPLSIGENPYPTNRMFCLLLAHLGHRAEVAEILDRFVVKRMDVENAEHQLPHFWYSQYLESAVLTGHKAAAELLHRSLTGTEIVTTGSQQTTCVLRSLGGASALLNRYDEARQHYQEAIRVCTEMRFRPELALSRLQLAELLLEHYPDEKKEALEHLDFAIKEFREMKMHPSLERALRHKEILKA